jgi:hypothetical protein
MSCRTPLPTAVTSEAEPFFVGAMAGGQPGWMPLCWHFITGAAPGEPSEPTRNSVRS